MTGVGGLFAASFSVEDLWPETTGLCVLVVSMFFIANFKVFRARIHATIEDDALRAILQNPSGEVRRHQWEVFGLAFGVVGLLFVWRGVTKTAHPYALLVAGFIAILLLVASWRKALSAGAWNEAQIVGHLRLMYDPRGNTVSILGDASGLGYLARVCVGRSGGPVWMSAPNALGGSVRLRIAYEHRTDEASSRSA